RVLPDPPPAAAGAGRVTTSATLDGGRSPGGALAAVRCAFPARGVGDRRGIVDRPDGRARRVVPARRQSVRARARVAAAAVRRRGGAARPPGGAAHVAMLAGGRRRPLSARTAEPDRSAAAGPATAQRGQAVLTSGVFPFFVS